MALPIHTKVTFSGVFGDGNSPAEIWSWSINTNPGGQVAPTSDMAGRARQLYGTYLKGLWNPDTTLTRTRVARIGTDGRVTRNPDGSYMQQDDVTNISGNAGGSLRYPLQTALCVSLDTPRPGASGKGRVFLPYTHHAIQGDWRLATADAASIAAQFQGFLLDFRNPTQGSFTDPALAAGPLGEPSVVSTGGAAASQGFLSPITSVRVGRVLDTMRSRRNAMLEGYAVQPMPAR